MKSVIVPAAPGFYVCEAENASRMRFTPIIAWRVPEEAEVDDEFVYGEFVTAHTFGGVMPECRADGFCGILYPHQSFEDAYGGEIGATFREIIKTRVKDNREAKSPRERR